MDIGTGEERNKYEVMQAKTNREAVNVMAHRANNVGKAKKSNTSAKGTYTTNWAEIDKRDNELVFRAKNGDQRAYEELLTVYRPLIWKCCASLSGKLYRDDIIDLVWIALIKAVNSYKPEKGVSFTCHLKHSLSFGNLKGLNHIMQIAEREELFKDGVMGEEMVPIGFEDCTLYDTEYMAVGHIIEDVVDALVEELDEEDRKVIYAIYYEDVSVAELAEREGVSRQTMNKRRNRGVEKLRALAKKKEALYDEWRSRKRRKKGA